jgi:hypothetical protein
MALGAIILPLSLPYIIYTYQMFNRNLVTEIAGYFAGSTGGWQRNL